MKQFKCALYHLWTEEPLYRYRSKRGDGAELRVLLLGYGTRMTEILNTVLCCGQMPHTDLKVTHAHPRPERARQALLDYAPDLPHFLSISEGQEETSTGYLGALHLRKTAMDQSGATELLEQDSKWGYILISTGSDEKNRDLAAVCAAFPFAQPVCIAYVQNSSGEPPVPSTPEACVKVIGGRNSGGGMEKLEQTALNIHWLYTKMYTERADVWSIRKKFREPYNYLSNMEAALHIWSKLACCGICEEDPREAAKKFAAQMKQQPEVVDSLSAVEHRRWVMQLLLEGYRHQDSLDRIFQNGITTSDPEEKWHCCLVTSEPTGKNRLTQADWDSTPKNRRKDLDELDLLSLRIHARCKELSEANADGLDELLQTLQFTISRSKASVEVQQELEQFNQLILQMRENNRWAVAMYDRSRRKLQKLLCSSDPTASGQVCGILDAIHQSLIPLIEYISHKDYKNIDRQMVRGIPFILTHRVGPALMKVWSCKQDENMFSPWVLEPEKLTYCISAETEREVQRFIEARSDTKLFFDHQSGQRELRWLLCIPKYLEDRVVRQLGSAMPDVKLILAEEWSVEGQAKALASVITAASPDYIDITGGDAMLVQSVLQSAEGPGLFYVKEGRMCSLRGANELEYEKPEKNLTVQEMFELSGARVQTVETGICSVFAHKYMDLWRIALEALDKRLGWSNFCAGVSRAYGDSKSNTIVLPLRPSCGGKEEKKQIRGISFGTVEKLLPMFRELERMKYLSSVTVNRDMDQSYCLSFRADQKRLDPERTEKFVRQCCEVNPSTHWYTLNKKQLVCKGLEVRNMDLPVADRKRLESEGEKNGAPCSSTTILQKMVQQELLLNYSVDPETLKCQFSFVGEDVLRCMQKGGTILEYVLYFTALQQAHFYDVKMGVSFQHSARNNETTNEIDVICTRGAVSLRISAKLKSDFNVEEFKYILYEISLLSDRFGLNAIPVLAAPMLNQFEGNNGKRRRSGRVEKALGRGVYLLGRECFDSGRLGEVLDRIADRREDWCDFLM